MEENKAFSLGCSNEHMDIKWISNINNYQICEPTIILNLGSEDILIENTNYEDDDESIQLLNLKKKYLKTGESMIFNDVNLLNGNLILSIKTKFIDYPHKVSKHLIKFPELKGDFTDNLYLKNGLTKDDIFNGKNWELFYDSVSDEIKKLIPQYKIIPLFVTPDKNKSVIGPVKIDPYKLCGQEQDDSEKKEYYIVSYIWFSPEQTNVGIHKKHDFLEIHTQISGIGRMQKFTKNDYESLYGELRLSPGQSHSPFCVVDPQNSDNYVYPWHQYYSDSDCIWIATEYYPADKFNKDEFKKINNI